MTRPFSVDVLDEYIDASGDCWLWTGRTGRYDYGTVGAFGKKNVMAHRAVWLVLVGPIPEGMHLDHLCRVPLCVNPDHLEPVTPAENNRRSPYLHPTHCRKGHELTKENRLAPPKRQCRTCRNAWDAEWSRRKRSRNASPRELLPCGTDAAYTRHIAHGETPCDLCRSVRLARRREQYAATRRRGRRA